MNKAFVFFFILFSKFSAGQTAVVKEIKQTNPITREVYIFPDIITASKTVTQKINDHLRAEILSADPGTTTNKIFDKVWTTNDQSPTVSDISYAVIRNKGSILSLSITAEGCGAYCETRTTYFSFNLNTGNKLTLDSLFTKPGIKALAENLNNSRTKKINAKIRELQKTIKSTKLSKNKTSKEDNLEIEMLDLYKNCLDKRIDPEYISYLGFTIRNKTLRIYSDRCSAHYNRAIDDLWEFEYFIDLKYWVKHLTTYGLELMKK